MENPEFAQFLATFMLYTLIPIAKNYKKEMSIIPKDLMGLIVRRLYDKEITRQQALNVFDYLYSILL